MIRVSADCLGLDSTSVKVHPDGTGALKKRTAVDWQVPPKANRLVKWDYDRTIYKRRNEGERLFRRLKGYRRIFSRFEKLDVMFRAFLNFALIVDMSKC